MDFMLPHLQLMCLIRSGVRINPSLYLVVKVLLVKLPQNFHLLCQVIGPLSMCKTISKKSAIKKPAVKECFIYSPSNLVKVLEVDIFEDIFVGLRVFDSLFDVLHFLVNRNA
jgi:hypothetical protein